MSPSRRSYRRTLNPPLNAASQVWAWKENVWEKEKGTLMERYTVEQSKPPSQGGAVVSTLTINNVMESDFHSPYNCTAWNAFGPGTMIITLEETGMEKTLSLVNEFMTKETMNETISCFPLNWVEVQWYQDQDLVRLFVSQRQRDVSVPC